LIASLAVTEYLSNSASISRIAVICDFQEENWPSMDLVANQLLDQLHQNYSHLLAASRICPALSRRFTHDQISTGRRFNADRFLNRFWDYPRFLRRRRSDFDLFHLTDHSYGQLLLELPPERTVVTCHDLDTFQCLLDPQNDPRSIFFRRMMHRTLTGFRKAARVTCDSAATREQLLAHELVAPERVSIVPNGVHPSFSPELNLEADSALAALIGDASADEIEILHVGSTIPRKRIDVLLQVLASLKEKQDLFPRLRLLRVGGSFTAAQLELAEKLRVSESISVLPHLDSKVLAGLYRRVALVLLPSEREGFGLPVIEALACGAAVVASDLPVLREVGGDAVTYCPLGDVDSWANAIAELLLKRRDSADHWRERMAKGITQAAKFSWAEYASKMVALYQELL
jgi:glycosyltransferase involved in cell wall biosynthesis